MFRPLFVYFKRPPLTADEIFDRLVPQYSPRGSNAREKEEAVTMLWIDFLQHLQSELVDIFQVQHTIEIWEGLKKSMVSRCSVFNWGMSPMCVCMCACVYMCVHVHAVLTWGINHIEPLPPSPSL